MGMLYSFMCCYSAAHSQPQPKRKSKRVAKKTADTAVPAETAETAETAVPTVSWTEEAMRNPFCDEHSMTLVRSLLTEGDQKRLSKEERARIVFQLMTKGRNHISKEQLAAVLCPSGVAMAEVESSFAELSSPIFGESATRGILFQTFFNELP